MQIIRKKTFLKSYLKLSENIQNKIIDSLLLFSKDYFNVKLNNHWLKWKYEWFRSINITWDYRIIYRDLSNWNYELIELVKVWTHSQLY